MPEPYPSKNYWVRTREATPPGSAPKGSRPFLAPRLIVQKRRLLEASEARVLGDHAPQEI